MNILARLRVKFLHSSEGRVVVMNGIESTLVSKVKKKQVKDPILLEWKANIHTQKLMTFEQEEDSILRYQGILGVPNLDEL